ncbi:MAG: hypothetical protein IJN10_09365 [Firmicutes bacterium]|nr:hypothetical protein [Bacillota bacterium]
MKLWKKVVTSILAAALLMSLSAGAVMAAEPYSYTVTFYAGNQGSFNGAGGLTVNSESAVITQSGDQIVISGLQLGDEVGLNAPAAVTLDASSKYYVQGIRLSGRDNDTAAASVFVVDGDADYVVAYGIKGNQVEYTVNYRDDAGNELAPSEVFYGNVGDKPVVAYKYIDGYVPEALGLTKTLSSNSAENVFTFEYDRAPVTTVVVPGEGTQGDTDQDQSVATPEESNTTTEPGDESSSITEESQPGDTEESSEVTEESAGLEEENEENESEIIVDLDEESIPLAPGAEDGAEDETDGTLTTYIAVGVISAVVLIAAVVVAIVIKKRSKK